jgi:hypothetical protein
MAISDASRINAARSAPLKMNSNNCLGYPHEMKSHQPDGYASVVQEKMFSNTTFDFFYKGER